MQGHIGVNPGRVWGGRDPQILGWVSWVSQGGRYGGRERVSENAIAYFAQKVR